MKELSIEEKAKAYDEALERAKIEYQTHKSFGFREMLTRIFPELKKSEDERIKKEMVLFLRKGTSYHCPNSAKRQEWANWLEKQGNTDSIIEKAKTEKQRVIITETDGRADIDWDTCSLEDVKKLLECGLQYINTELEKQDKQIIANSTKTCNDEQKTVEWHREDEQNLNTCLGYIPDEYLRRWLMDIVHVKYDKPADKVEPKFKVGDEIKTAKEESLIITKITEEGYWSEDLFICGFDEECLWDKVEPKFKIEKGKWYVCIKELLDNYTNKAFREGDIYLSTQDGSLIPSNSNVPFEVVCPDTYFRDWTIQDAKDGDVLATSNYIYIFNSIDKETETVAFYCVMKKSDEYFSFGDYRIHDEILNSVPATKEQCDTLIKAMVKAGCEFDFEKKEFKKIEQKSTDMIESTPHNYITPNKQFFQWIYDRLIYVHNENPNVDYMLSLKERIENMQKPTWSEEDEKMLDTLIADYEFLSKKYSDQEHDFFVEISLAKDDLDMISWFKSLKDRVCCEANCTTTKEWSEEDKAIFDRANVWLNNLCDYLKNCSSDCIHSEIKNIIKKLESFKERCIWKPSDEQMKVLYKYAEQNNYDGTILTSLYNDLKQL